MPVEVDEFEVADPPADAWIGAGFSVDSAVGTSGGICRIGGVRIRLLGRERGTGIVGWSLRGLPSDDSIHDLDGIPPTVGSDGIASTPAGHANGVTAIDHVVLLSPDLGRTVESLAAVGLEPRRERDANSAAGRSARSSIGSGGR